MSDVTVKDKKLVRKKCACRTRYRLCGLVSPDLVHKQSCLYGVVFGRARLQVETEAVCHKCVVLYIMSLDRYCGRRPCGKAHGCRVRNELEVIMDRTFQVVVPAPVVAADLQPAGFCCFFGRL